VFASLSLTVAIAYVFAATTSEQLRWKMVFGAIAIFGVLKSLNYVGVYFQSREYTSWLSSLRNYAGVLMCGCVVFVSIADATAGVRRDWLHWIGVATFLASTCVFLLLKIGWWLIAARL